MLVDDARLVVDRARSCCGCSAIALTMARIRNGSSVSFGRSARFSALSVGAQLLERGDVDLLDIGDMRDARLGERHLLGDACGAAR